VDSRTESHFLNTRGGHLYCHIFAPGKEKMAVRL
jgi:hypothetical protein